MMTQPHTLKLTVKTASGDKKIDINLENLVDVYKGGNGIEISDDGTVSTLFNIADYALSADTDTALAEKADSTAMTESIATAKEEAIAASSSYTDSAVSGKADSSTVDNLINSLSSATDSKLDLKADSTALTSVMESISAVANALSAAIVSNNSEISSISGDLATEISNRESSDTSLNAAIDSLSGIVSTKADASALTETNENIASISGNVEAISGNVDTLSGTVETKADSTELDEAKKTIEVLSTMLDTLITSIGDEKVDGGDVIDDNNLSFFVTGTVKSNYDGSYESSVVTMNALNLALLSNDIAENTQLKINAETVAATNVTVNGEYPQSLGNARCSINNAKTTTFKNLTFSEAASGYNFVEIGMDETAENLPKEITFDNCKFDGKLSHAAISIFAMDNDAVITFKNCSFKDTDTTFRLTNRTLASGATINFIDCTSSWAMPTDGDYTYTGPIICQDNYSTSENYEDRNMFGGGKITINFTNFVGPNGKIEPCDASAVSGSKDANQLLFVFVDYAVKQVIDYSANTYPTVNVQ